MSCMICGTPTSDKGIECGACYVCRPCVDQARAYERVAGEKILANTLLEASKAEVARLKQRADENERQLVAICGVFGGKDARHVEGAGEKSVAGLVKQEVERLKKRLTLKRNDEGIWLYIKTDTIQAAVLMAGPELTRGPIVMAALEAALAEKGGGA